MWLGKICLMGEEITWRLSAGNQKLEPLVHPKGDLTLRCSFCDKSQAEVAKLFSNPSGRVFRAYICDECVAGCDLVMKQDSK